MTWKPVLLWLARVLGPAALEVLAERAKTAASQKATPNDAPPPDAPGPAPGA